MKRILTLVLALLLVAQLAQLAQPVEASGGNVLILGTASASTFHSAPHSADKAFDGNDATRWSSAADSPQWVAIDLGVGVTRRVTRMRMRAFRDAGASQIGHFLFQASNDGTTWTTLLDAITVNNDLWQEWTFPNTTAYRHYRVKVLSRWASVSPLNSIWGIEGFECPPTVETAAATLVTDTTATLNTNIVSVGGGDVTTRGFEWDVDSGVPYTHSFSETGNFPVGAFSHNLTGLTPATQYFFRGFATNAHGTSHGAELSFITSPSPPTMFTATDIDGTTIGLSWTKGTGATTTHIRGKLGSAPTSRADGAFSWSGITSTVNHTVGPNETWHYIAWSEATVAGTVVLSNPPDPAAHASTVVTPPTVTTDPATLITDTTATLNANITSLGGEPHATARGFQWDTDSGVPYTHVFSETGTFPVGAFTHNLTVLAPGTQYFFRSFATTAVGTSYGPELSFITPPSSPTAFTATTPDVNTITLTWTKGIGATVTHIRGKLNTAPTSRTDGTFSWSGTTSTVNHTVTAGETWHYIAWSEVTVAATVLLSDPPDPTVHATPVLLPPTHVAATDGVHTASVVITWTKATGATGYQVYRDGVPLGWVGDVNTFTDTGAGAPTVTPGTASATDGVDPLVLSLTGHTVAPGSIHVYTVRARCVLGGESVPSTSDGGFRGTGPLSFQWQESAGDSEAGFADIAGATTVPFTHLTAPGDGTGRFYRVLVSAPDAVSQLSTADRGWRGPPGAPSAPLVTPIDATRLDVTWDMGPLSSKTYIVRKIGSPPVDRLDGVTVFFGTGTAFSDSGLEPHTAYFYRLWSFSEGGAIHSVDSVHANAVTPGGLPVVVTRDATQISVATARLNALLQDDGGIATEVQFEYDVDSGAPYAFSTPWVAGYSAGSFINKTLEGLSPNTQYFFRFRARNVLGVSVGAEKSFWTFLHIGSPTDLAASVIGPHSVALSWSPGLGSTQTLIRYSVGVFPVARTDGNLAYLGPGGTFLVENLEPGKTYFFRAWAEAGGLYSPGFSSAVETTMAGGVVVVAPVDVVPRWWQATDYTMMQHLPIFAMVNNFGDAFGAPRSTTWISFTLVIIALASLILFQITHSALTVVIFMGFSVFAAVLMQLLPMWIMLPIVLGGGGFGLLRGRV